MKNLKCLIVDDEPPAVRLLQKYVKEVTFLELVTSTRSPLEALRLVEQEDIDLLFLDIQMPELTGIQLSKILQGKTRIIFTTAYPQFALESYEVNAVDYLLKPFDFQRFYSAVLKMRTSIDSRDKDDRQENDPFLFVKTNGKNNFQKIFTREICYIEGLKNYVAIHLLKEIVITYNSLKRVQKDLPSTKFIQIHKSYIISLRHIEKTDSLSVYVNNKALPIGDTYKQEFFNAVNKMKL